MNEILRAKRLTEEILSRAASIKNHMADVNQRIINMELMEKKARSLPEEVQALLFVDLPPEIVVHIARQLKSHVARAALSQAIINDDASGWEELCRLDWNIVEANPGSIPCLDNILLRNAASVVNDISLADIDLTELSGNVWKNVYRDRVQGWRLVATLLQWLRDHNYPERVTGSMHRLQLQLALQYMVMGTPQPGDWQRRQQVLQLGGLRALLALLHNDSPSIQEAALMVLANLMVGDPETKLMVMAYTQMGRTISSKLECHLPGVMQQACRALVNLWAEAPVPEVVVLTPCNGPARPVLEPGLWHLQEYTLRGECKLVQMLLTFDLDGGTIQGAGFDDSGEYQQEFNVSGVVDAVSGVWSFQRSCLADLKVVHYKGTSDAHGAFGMYTARQVETSLPLFLFSKHMSPRVFRLYRPGTGQQAPAAAPACTTWAAAEQP